MIHLFFEQSGTFKNEFIKLGYPAEDYDIRNDFGQTDHIIDLFAEINSAFEGGASVFDKITTDDLIMAFFPCVRFENQIYMHFQGTANQYSKYSDVDKLIVDLKLHDELHEMYRMITELVLVCKKKGLRLIIENPYNVEHYLTRYWALKPALIDCDRRERGDYFKKPTQYWFINISPKSNFIWEITDDNSLGSFWAKNKANFRDTKAPTIKVARSMIHPQYANRFIREFLVGAI